MIRSKLFTIGLAAVALAVSTVTAHAQPDLEALRARFLIPEPPAPPAEAGGGLANLFRGAPGTNTGTPLAFGASMGDFFVGAGYQSETRGFKQPNGTFIPGSGESDGSVSAGFGLGDASGGISLTTVITSLSTFRSGFGNRTAFSFAVSRNITETLAIGVGVENAFITGGGQTDGSDSWYGVVSKMIQNPGGSSWLKALTLSGGVGNGRFRMVDDVNSGNETVNVFGSAAALLHDQFSLITDWTGQDLNIGASFVPFKAFPMSITPALVDVLGIANDKPRFTLGVGIGMHF
jgi:hypothetical protein